MTEEQLLEMREYIVSSDKRIKTLTSENESLKKRIEELEQYKGGELGGEVTGGKMDRDYGAAEIDFLERDSGRVKRAYLYPIKKIKMMNLDLKTWVEFDAINGEWKRKEKA